MSTKTETPGYIPISEWPNLEALAVGYNEHLMADSTQLSGKHLAVVFSDTQIMHHFVDGHALKWEVVRYGQNGNAEYRAFEV